jgi:hypothetical protein
MAPYTAGVALRIGADALVANPLRTLLSTAGVIIGVASLVAVLSLGDGMQNAARTQMEHLTDEFHHMVLAAGRFFTNAEAERGAPVVVLSQKLANELAAGGDPRRLVGHDVRVNGLAIAVVGVLAPYDGETGYDAYVPFLTAPKVFPPSTAPRPATILLRAAW